MKPVAALLVAFTLTSCSKPPELVKTEITPPVAAPDTAIRNTSFADAAGVRTIQLSAVLPASLADSWTAIATPEGWKTWAVPYAAGEIRTGGVLETAYNPAARPGDPGNIQQQIVAVIPQRILVFRTIRVPAGFEHAEDYYKTSTAIDLASEGQGLTRITLTHTGFAKGEGFDKLYGFFEQGDASTLEELRKRFETGPADFGKQK